MSSVFMSYSHADEAMRDRLETHLALLKREGAIQTWHDRRIVPGARLEGSIVAEAETADIFLFLVSADFLASTYCYEIEMARALEREQTGEASILPVVLHTCEWLRSPLGKFAGVPKDGKPIAKFPYPEDAYVEVAAAVQAPRSGSRAEGRKDGKPSIGQQSSKQRRPPCLSDGGRQTDAALAQQQSLHPQGVQRCGSSRIPGRRVRVHCQFFRGVAG